MELDYVNLLPGEVPPPLATGPFCAVIVAEVEVAQDWRNQISEWLVKGGCLYVVAWGIDCEAWHDTVDWVNLEEFDFGEIPDERFVMTSWHDRQPLSDALFFAGQCAFHPDVELKRTVIVHIANEAREAQLLADYALSQIVDED